MSGNQILNSAILYHENLSKILHIIAKSAQFKVNRANCPQIEYWPYHKVLILIRHPQSTRIEIFKGKLNRTLTLNIMPPTLSN